MDKKITTFQLCLLSTGGMLGCGWLFSPFYGYQTAGIGVLYSWVITAIITIIIGLSFAEVCSLFPVVGGIYRLIGITHNKDLAGIFLILGWLSYVVYLPLEAQSVIQYLGFWLPSLVTEIRGQIELSWAGICLAAVIILSITWFNTLLITKVAKANSLISMWKILIPLVIAVIAILGYGHWSYFSGKANMVNFSFENVLLAVTSSGLAFAFSGFQNGLIFANQVKDPVKALPYSLFMPVLIGFTLYASLSSLYLACLNGNSDLLMNTTAPLLGVLSLLGLNWLFTILFIDAVVAPLGTTNVYVAATSRILFSVGKELSPNSILTKINKNNAPIVALWINAFIGIMFLFPFPTWKELVNFLSSIVVFAYLAGPVCVLALRKEQPSLERGFKLSHPNLVSYAGFICCSWLIYWSGVTNLGYLIVIILIVVIGYFFYNRVKVLSKTIGNIWYLLFYLGCLWFVSFLHLIKMIAFPFDNFIIGCIGYLFCHILVYYRLPSKQINININSLKQESCKIS